MMLIEFVQEDRLNPVIFDSDMRMKPVVRDALLDIANEFISYVSDDGLVDVNYIDAVVVGSQAGYNYTPYSDLDLHLVVDLYEICRCCPEVVQKLFNSEKSRFNNSYDISLKGIPVEVYVEDVRASTMSNGIYSLVSDNWIKQPVKRNPDVFSLDEKDYELVSQFKSMIDNAIASGDPDQVQSVVDKVYLMRKQGLEAGGEESRGNKVFKELRNKGYLDKLKNSYYELKSNQLSLEGLKF